MEQEIKLHATNLNAHGYGKGWQINALIAGEESEITYYGVTKDYSLRQAKAYIKEYGRLPNKPYREADAIFKGFTAREIELSISKELSRLDAKIAKHQETHPCCK